ncbi:hypothetical protein NR756_04875 [Alloalcanivorax xenomutans]|jgi:hypothetical protein|uniref:hypothetical protein n=1 Tax=Alloalcanivorax xenomutans TaxID=1094342 RepID=UPI0011C07C23
MNRNEFGLCTIAFGVISSIFLVKAGYDLGASGFELTELRSVGGRTVAEAYYQEMGHFGMAIAKALYGLATAVFSLSVGIGGSLISSREISEDETPQL